MILGVENGSYNIGHITRRSFTPQTLKKRTIIIDEPDVAMTHVDQSNI
jgi:hypothetical protein